MYSKKISFVFLFTLLSILCYAQGRKGDMFVWAKRLTQTFDSKAPNNTFRLLLNGPINNSATINYSNQEEGKACQKKVEAEPYILVDITTSDVTVRLDELGNPVVLLGVFLMVDYEASVLIKDYTGKIISSRKIFEKGQKNTAIQLTTAQAINLKLNKNELQDLVNSKKQIFFNETVLSSYIILSRHACGAFVADSLYIYSGKGKAYDYSKLDATMEAVVALGKQVNTKKIDTVLLKKTVLEAIELWTAECATYEQGNPEARINTKLFRALQYNIAVGYFLIRDMSKAYEYAILARYDSEEKDAKIKVTDNFESRVEDLIKLIEINF
ncbi:MAG: hypothetical protein MUE33_00620 [Cytophagaceae bacterium]|jgi:hypothetical protein|nr:hypothetical protein [Cytophagaceae bacterium]